MMPEKLEWLCLRCDRMTPTLAYQVQPNRAGSPPWIVRICSICGAVRKFSLHGEVQEALYPTEPPPLILR